MTAHESMSLCYVHMHNQRAPFTDINVRKAFSHAFNYDSFINDVLKGRAVRNPGPMPRSMWGYPKDLLGYTYDLDKAKAYLAQAQVKIDRPIEIHIQSEFEQTTQAALLLQSDLAKLGIELRVIKSLFPNIVAATKTTETTPDMWIHWVGGLYVDPENWLGDATTRATGARGKPPPGTKTLKSTQLLPQARSPVEREGRAGVYEEVCRLVVDDAPDIWVYSRLEYPPLAKNVQGFEFCPVGAGGTSGTSISTFKPKRETRHR